MMQLQSIDRLGPVQRAWLDAPEALQDIGRRLEAGTLRADEAARCREFAEHGYCVVSSLVPDALTHAAAAAPWQVIEAMRGRPREEILPRLANCWHENVGVRAAMQYRPLVAWVELLMGCAARPFHSLSLPESSQQGAHSDEVFMRTSPRGLMVAAWIALEDVQADAGPVVVWPGSHRWRYLGMSDIGVGSGWTQEQRHQRFDAAYYSAMRQRIGDAGVAGHPQLLRRGDVLFWHQNTVHAGDAVTRAGATRNSLVVHYVARGCTVDSDLTGSNCVLPEL